MSEFDSSEFIWPYDQVMKALGDKHFNEEGYAEAICYYSRAINKNPTVATYFKNRAICYLKLKRWALTVLDCYEALRLDSNCLECHSILGAALLETGNHNKYDLAIKHFQKAYDLAREKGYLEMDATSQIRLARKKRWNIQEEKRIAEDIELWYVNRLILEDSQRQITKLKQDSGTNGTDEETQNKIIEQDLK